MTFIRALRIISSAILAGVVFAGMVGAWFSLNLPFDPHWIGVVMGALAGITLVVAFRSQTRRRVAHQL